MYYEHNDESVTKNRKYMFAGIFDIFMIVLIVINK